jgi:pimeloyl-ACP methyl ester carboxylesterase
MRFILVLLLLLPMALVACGGDDDDDVSPTEEGPIGATAGEATATEPDGRRPVIFVPGAAGSKLMAGSDEAWAAIAKQIFSLSDDFLANLALEADGETSVEQVTVGDVLRSETIELFGIGVHDVDFYGTLIETFNNAGYVEDERFFIYPYDWRIDVDVEAERFKAFIDAKLNETGAEQVDIVAHSMGGLVTLAALGDSDMDGKVGKVVTLGTPVLGATKALGVLEYKALCFTEEILDIHCITNETTAQQVVTNFPGAYQLLPSRAFEDAVGSPLEDEGSALDYDDWTAIVHDNRNADLMNAAEAWQANLPREPHDENVEMLRIVGDNQGTPVQIERKLVKDCYFLFFGCSEKVKYTIQGGSGDGTVPLASASLQDDTRNFDQNGAATVHPMPDVSHMALAQDDDVLAYVLNFLGITGVARVASIAPAGNGLSAEYDREPRHFDGLILTVIGPAWGTVRSGDDFTGPVPGEEPDVYYEGIPGSSFWRIGDSQAFVFSGDGEYRAELSVVADDSIEYAYLTRAAAPEEVLDNVVLITAERYRDGEVDDATIFRVEPSAGATLYLEFEADSDPDELDLLIDRDNDGEVDDEAVRVDDFEPLEDGGSTPEPTEPEVEFVDRTLIEIGPNNQLEPGLIEAWEISDNGNQITARVDRDVVLEDGSRLTSERVIELLDENIDALRQYEYIAARPIDDFTFVIVIGTTQSEQFLAELANVSITVRE